MPLSAHAVVPINCREKDRYAPLDSVPPRREVGEKITGCKIPRHVLLDCRCCGPFPFVPHRYASRTPASLRFLSCCAVAELMSALWLASSIGRASWRFSSSMRFRSFAVLALPLDLPWNMCDSCLKDSLAERVRPVVGNTVSTSSCICVVWEARTVFIRVRDLKVRCVVLVEHLLQGFRCLILPRRVLLPQIFFALSS